MTRMVLLTFAFLGWAWFELSGGTEFVAGQNGVTMLARVEARTLPPAEPVTVARADTSAASLTDVIAAVAIETEPQKLVALTDPAVMTDATPEPVAAVLEAAVVAADLRAVTGNRVNLRFGPGTDYAVVTQLLRGDEVEVLADQADGWVKLRALDSNRVGWMSSNFLATSN